MMYALGRTPATHVDHVVERTVLRDSDKDRLVVRGGVDRRKTVDTSGETTGNVSREDTVRRGGVQALEERELGRVRGRGLVERGERLVAIEVHALALARDLVLEVGEVLLALLAIDLRDDGRREVQDLLELARGSRPPLFCRLAAPLPVWRRRPWREDGFRALRSLGRAVEAAG